MQPLVSILINNYNYARFLSDAIESAIRQTYHPVEIIVVDDGSTDASRHVIASYKDRIIPVLKTNGGQASAFNAGIRQSSGKLLCFLDSDDLFYPNKVEKIVELSIGHREKPVLIHHPLEILDESSSTMPGQPIGRTHPSPLSLYDFAKRYHFVTYEAGPTTGISLTRPLADLIFPLPEDGIRVSADDFIVKGASVVGQLYSHNAPLGAYRVHGENAWFSSTRQKSREFTTTLDAYLNNKLVEAGRPPVMSFYDSMGAWSFLAAERKWRDLLLSMVKLTARQRDAETIRYIVIVLRQVLRQLLKAGARG